MSKFFNSFIKVFGIGLLLLFGILSLIDLNHGLLSFEWIPYKKFFIGSEKKGNWIDVEKGMGFYPTGLDKRWVCSILSSLQVKVALRKSIIENEESLDLVYEAKGKLTRPVLSEEYKDYEVDYRINFEFKFIDEDGFVMQSFNPSYYKSTLSHEKYEESDLTYMWGDQENENKIIKLLFAGHIRPNVMKRIKKITYEPSIEVTNAKKIKSVK